MPGRGGRCSLAGRRRGYQGLVLGLTALPSLPTSTPQRCLGAAAAPRGLGPGQPGAHLLSGLGWEAAGGAAWHVQSDGQLLQLVQAVAGARQVSWSPLSRCRPRGWGQLRPEGRVGAPHLSSGKSLSQAAGNAFAPGFDLSSEEKLGGVAFLSSCI